MSAVCSGCEMLIPLFFASLVKPSKKRSVDVSLFERVGVANHIDFDRAKALVFRQLDFRNRRRRRNFDVSFMHIVQNGGDRVFGVRDRFLERSSVRISVKIGNGNAVPDVGVVFKNDRENVSCFQHCSRSLYYFCRPSSRVF